VPSHLERHAVLASKRRGVRVLQPFGYEGSIIFRVRTGAVPTLSSWMQRGRSAKCVDGGRLDAHDRNELRSRWSASSAQGDPSRNRSYASILIQQERDYPGRKIGTMFRTGFCSDRRRSASK